MFIPTHKTLQNYACVLVDFALGGGKGIKRGDIVYFHYDEPAKPLALEVYRRILQREGFPLKKASSEDFAKILFSEGSDTQLEFFPKKYLKTLIDTIDHRIYLMAQADPLYLSTVNPDKIIKSQKGLKTLRKWIFAKEDKGDLTWTLALYGTEGMARQAGISLGKYWGQIEGACFLSSANPISKWKKTTSAIERVKNKLNKMPIKTISIRAKDTDLTLVYGEKRKFVGGGGCNIPSFEIFTSPDWRGTNGNIYFDLPLYRYGNIVRDIHLEFKEGRIVKANAGKNEKLLKTIIKQKNADKVGEFSLTDTRFSKITRFMANTLYDENFGGKYGNTHIAIGSSYHDTFDGDPIKLKAKDWRRLGFNESGEHVDIIAAHDRTVKASLADGSEKVIYKNGKFVV